MNEVMFVTGGELLQFLPISIEKKSRYEYLFLTGILKEEKYKWGQIDFH